MAKFSTLTRQHPAEATFQHEGESVTIVFDRNKITSAWARQVRAGLEAGEINAAAQALVEIMVSWDVEDDNGVNIPPSVEILDKLPVVALMRLEEAIGEASVPSSAEGEASSAPSPGPSTTSSEPAPQPLNGQAPSPLPVPSGSPS